MSEGRPRLVAVPEQRPVGAQQPGPRRVSRHAVWLLAVALALAALGWGMARREAALLTRELEATRGALSAAQGRLEVAEAQRARVRTHVEALAAEASAFAGRLGELEALVSGDLEPANDTQPAGKESDRID